MFALRCVLVLHWGIFALSPVCHVPVQFVSVGRRSHHTACHFTTTSRFNDFYRTDYELRKTTQYIIDILFAPLGIRIHQSPSGKAVPNTSHNPLFRSINTA